MHSFIPIEQQTIHLAQRCLLGKMVDHPMDPDRIREALQGDYSIIEGDIDIQELGNAWILFKFSTNSEQEYVFENRPYHVQGHLLALYSWTDSFRPLDDETSRVDLWARIPLLPLQLFADNALDAFLREAGVGDLIRIDQDSNMRNQMKFARFCVNVDITGPLVRRVPYLHGELRVWYEDYSPGCGCCGREGHVFAACPRITNPPRRIHVALQGDHVDDADAEFVDDDAGLVDDASVISADAISLDESV